MGVLASYFRKPILIMLFLGFAAGLPLALIFSTIKAFLVDRQIDLSTIGFFSLVALPYSIKFLWAPLIDSIKIPILAKILGKRRSWIILTQILLILLISLLGIYSNFTNLSIIILLATLIAFTSASQDIVIDAYRIESIKIENQAIAASMYIYGYRVGMLISGALALTLSDKIAWDLVYYFIASVMGIGVLTTLIADENKDQKIQNKQFYLILWFKNSVIAPLKDLTTRSKWYFVLLFIVSFKLTDAFAGNLFLPFLLEIDFSKTQIATIVKTFGLFATLFGAFIGGILVKKLGLIKSLFLAAILQIISNFGFYYLTFVGNDITSLYVVIFIENLSGGIGDVIFVAYLSSLCNIKFTATQYSLLASLASIARSLISSPAGVFAQNFGWGNFFLLSIVLGIPTLVLLCLIKKTFNHTQS